MKIGEYTAWTHFQITTHNIFRGLIWAQDAVLSFCTSQLSTDVTIFVLKAISLKIMKTIGI